jgi:MFS family permease
MQRKQLLQFFNPILSMLILTLGNGLYTTITTLQLKSMQLSAFSIGLVSAAYFIGLTLGPFHTQYTIVRVGHIRAYGVFAGIMTASVLVQGMTHMVFAWAMLRFFAGYALAGLFICIESWLLAGAEDNAKGRVMGLYLFVYYITQACSQLLLKINFSDDLMQFVFIGLMAVISILPVMLTRFSAPRPDDMQLTSPLVLLRKVPLGMWASFLGGMLLAVIYTMYPLVLKLSGFSRHDIALMMFATVLGGALLQLPVGKFSDMIDRRKVLFLVCMILAILALVGLLWHHGFWVVLALSFLVGGFCFTIYPLAISHTGDYVEPALAVSAITVLTVIYGLGSVIGPIVLPVYLHWHMSGYFAFLITVAILLAAICLWRMTKRDAVPSAEQASYVPVQPQIQVPSTAVVEQLDVSDNTTQT